jgi:hypothetical protein
MLSRVSRSLAAASLAAFLTACVSRQAAEVGFWFEPVSFDSPRIGALTVVDMDAIVATAVGEIQRAFAGLPITISENRDARFRVRVVQELDDPRFRRRVGIAGASHSLTGSGGDGAVSFYFLASGALTFAPADIDRATIIAAIGTGIGRTAVHELVHQMFPTAPIHDSADVSSYEYASAARAEQFYGPMRWNLARPLLEKRFASAR